MLVLLKWRKCHPWFSCECHWNQANKGTAPSRMELLLLQKHQLLFHFALVKLYMIRRFSFIFCQLHMCNEQVESYVLKDNMLVTSDSTDFSFAVLDEDRAQTLPSANL